ncbi:putative F-box/FBD/LRR-repeat protein isoform X2 [Iris pallida]|uniref:F-box/FBD/LRR-repeat protein isoform X2 n=1 Tax=Iris pallida TaxID=29817 RepID=A0AAX6EBL3_IRIPA|nr:putative F-box/FBD/LRR-repeat protein isoform X2 [Iris pallida]
MRRGFLLSVPKPSPPLPPPSSSSSSESSDRLSSLPDAILLEILSLLCTDEIVRTGILSRRWRGLWTRSPVLHLARNYSVSFVERVDVDLPSVTDLLLTQCSSNPKIVSASFPLSNDPAASLRADRCIRFASARSVERLSFNPILLGRLRVPMPPSLFGCHSLTELRLNSCSISSSSVPPRKKKMCFFPTLRTIILTSVSIDDAQMEALLENCPVLESLSLSSIREITRLVIRAPHMRHLMVYGCGGLVRVELVEAPEMRRLMYNGDVSRIGNLEGKVPKVEEVALVSTKGVPFKNPAGWRRLVGAVATARILSVSSWFFKFPLTTFGPGGQEVVFKNLKELHWWPVYHKSPGALGEFWSAEKISTSSLRALLSMLRDCPSLEQLCIRATYNLEHEHDDMYWIMRPFSSRQYHAEELSLNIDSVGYEFPCLKTVNIAEFSGRKVEMKLVKFIAEKAVALESVNLHYVEDIQSELEGIRRVFTSIHKASPHATISFSEFDEDKVCSKHEHMWYDYVVV